MRSSPSQISKCKIFSYLNLWKSPKKSDKKDHVWYTDTSRTGNLLETQPTSALSKSPTKRLISSECHSFVSTVIFNHENYKSVHYLCTLQLQKVMGFNCGGWRQAVYSRCGVFLSYSFSKHQALVPNALMLLEVSPRDTPRYKTYILMQYLKTYIFIIQY